MARRRTLFLQFENGPDSQYTFEDLFHAPTVLGALEGLPLQGFTQLDRVESMIIRSILSISTVDRRQLAIEDPLAFQTTRDVKLALQSFIVRPPCPTCKRLSALRSFLFPCYAWMLLPGLVHSSFVWLFTWAFIGALTDSSSSPLQKLIIGDACSGGYTLLSGTFLNLYTFR